MGIVPVPVASYKGAEGMNGPIGTVRWALRPVRWRAGDAKRPGDRGRSCLPASVRGAVRGARPPRSYFSPLSMALTSSPLSVSPLKSQKKAPPRPCSLAQLILEPMVFGVS